MKKQPFLLVLLENGKTKLINESQVVSVEGKNKLVYLRMSNGDEIIIKQPAYEDWENDFHTRKD